MIRHLIPILVSGSLGASVALAGDLCVLDGGFGVPDGTLLQQMEATSLKGEALYRQCVHGTLGSMFSVSDLPGPPVPAQATAVHATPASMATDASGAETAEAAIRRLLASEPALVLGALQRAQEEQRQAADAERNRKLAESWPSIVETGIAAGAADPDVTIVEWLDYGCPYCQQSEPEVRRMLESDPKVRIVYKQLPILGPGSVLLARAALAAGKQGGFLKFHEILMGMHLGHGKDPTMEQIANTARSAGLDPARLEADLKGGDIDATLTNTQLQAAALQIRSTPTFAFGGEIVPSGLTFQGLTERVGKARQQLLKARTGQ